MRVEIRALAHGGAGVGQTVDEPGPTWFVEGALPGEVVEAQADHTAKRFVRGHLLSVVDASEERVAPPCEVADRCGGCGWQHLAAAQQADHKRRIVADQLRGIVDGIDAVRLGATPSPTLGYRRRARLHYERGRDGTLALGFFRRRSKDIEDVPACPVLVEPLRAALGRLRAAGSVLPQRGEVLGLSDGTVAVLGLPGVRPDPAVREALHACLDASLVGIVLRGGRRSATIGRGRLEIDARDGLVGVRASPFVFVQAHAQTNRALVQHVARAARADGRRVLELFCGAGNFTRALARTARRVWAVDDDREAIGLLQKMAETHRLPINAQKASAHARVVRIAAGDTRYDVVVLDPPRRGLSADAAEAVATVATDRIVYVSCDPATLRRDLDILCAHGWRVDDVTVFDMMPMTPQIETVVTLRRGDG